MRFVAALFALLFGAAVWAQGMMTLGTGSIGGCPATTCVPTNAANIATLCSNLTNGQSIAFPAGAQFRQECRINANNVTVEAYGVGARPILDGSDIYLNANFTKTGGLTNVYQTTTITFLAGGTAAFVPVFETGGPGDNATGTYLLLVANNATVDSTPCSYTIAGMAADGTLPASAQIFIHTCDGTSPIVNGYVYEFSNRPTGLYMAGSNNRVDGIETRKGADDLGSLQCQGDGAACTFNNVLARDGGKHNAFAACGSTVTNSYFINGYYSTVVSNLLVFFDNTGSGKPITVTGNFFQQDQTLAGATPTAALQHTGSGNCGTVAFNSNWLIAKNSANLSGISFSNVTSISTNGNFASQLLNYLSPAINTTATNDQYVSDLNNNTPVVAVANGVTLTLSGVKICSSHNQNGLIFNNASTGLTYNITNTLLYLNTPLSGSYPFAIAFQIGAGITLNVNGSDFGSANSEFYNYNMFVAGNTFTGDNNIYELSATTHWVKDGTTFNSLVLWKAAVTPQDLASVTTGGNAVSACTLPSIPVIN